jgi:hypothetical protein
VEGVGCRGVGIRGVGVVDDDNCIYLMDDGKNGVWMILLCFMESSHGVSTS